MNPNAQHCTQPAQPTHGATPHPHDGRVTVTPAKPDQLLSLAQVTDMVSLSKSSIYAMLKRKEFPRPLCLSRRAVRWPLSAVQSWIESRINEGGQS